MTMKSLLKFLHRLEDTLLISMFLIMMLATVGQILMRNITGAGIIWADPLVRIVVLWAGLLGAMAATRQNNHITIDVITRHLSVKARKLVNSFTMLCTGVLCGIVAYYSLQFVRMEYEFSTMAFANIPAWICQAVIPFAFSVISFRCLVSSMTCSLMKPEP